MKKNSPEYYWESMLKKQEEGDVSGFMTDYSKVLELDPEYKAYCHSKKEKESDFLAPMVDYYWWKKNVKGKENERR